MNEAPEESQSALPPLPDDPELLRAIVEGTVSSSASPPFANLVRQLAKITGARFALVAEFLPSGRARSTAIWSDGRMAEDREWEIAATPCEQLIRTELCHYATGVRDRFPSAAFLADLGVDGYLGVSLRDPEGTALGHLAAMHDRPLPASPRQFDALRILAAHAANELRQIRVTRELADSQRRYRDLFEEAPIAYVYEDLDSRFVSANRAALRLLGLRPEEVPETIGKSLLAPTPENRERIDQLLSVMKSEGKEFSWVELELRRKDNGEPVWIRWWSKPDPDGRHTRTMLVDMTEQVLLARQKARLEQQNLYFQEEIKSVHNFDEIVGRSPALLRVLDDVRRVAATEVSVLIGGETGTGKELIARAIHSTSARRDKPLIKINCATLPAGLVESELFGHERGAFSGAIARRIGRFELAHGGTIFLDEIGELPLDLQAKLLRVLQERELERVGGSVPIQVDVRILAATNRDLDRAIDEGRFRSDLFYRLNVFPIRVPPLRERREDIPLLVRFIVDRFAGQVGKKIGHVSEQTLQRLTAYSWPGNVRELQNVLERAVILARDETLVIDADQLLDPPPTPATTSAPSGLKIMERRHILAALEKTDWVIEGPRGAAKLLDLHPNTLRSRMKRLEIRRP